LSPSAGNCRTSIARRARGVDDVDADADAVATRARAGRRRAAR